MRTPEHSTTSWRTTTALAAALLLAASLALLTGPLAGDASAATARGGRCYYFDIGAARFHNYDYLSTRAYCNNVDWATSLVFYNYANINYVKSILHGRGYPANSTDGMHMPVKSSNTGHEWDRDAGKKGVACPTSGRVTRHYRIYAPPSRDYMYAPGYGFFVVGTTHYDANECPPIGKRHYGSERVEQDIVSRMRGAGFPVYPNWADFLNWEPYRVEGNHTWENNGLASYININR